jgi:superfamily II DNA or RNA helicase
MELRKYQLDLLQQTLAAWQSSDRVLLQLPTGAGKTELAMELILHIPGTILFVTHRKELVAQASKRFAEVGITHSFISGDYPCDLSQRVLICTIQTLHRIKERLDPVLIIEDEAHHSTSKMYENLHNTYNQCKYLGLTATPRSKIPLSNHYEVLIQGPSILELIQGGYLAEPKIAVPPETANLVESNKSSWKVTGGDYNPKAINEWFADNSKVIYGDVIAHYRTLAGDNPTLVFCPSVKSVYETVQLFKDNGITAAGIDGSLSDEARQVILSLFANSEVKCLMSCDLISEGFNTPMAKVGIFLRPTRSLTIYLQQIGRLLRPTPDGSKAIIIDHVNNCEQFGPPWIQRHWSLEGYGQRSKHDTLSGINMKLCLRCGNYIDTSAMICKHCGYVFKNKSKAFKVIYEDLKIITIESAQKLIESTVQKIINKEQWKMLKTREDFVEFAKAKGWANPEVWADKKLEEKKADDEIFFRGNRDQLIVLYAKRKNANPGQKADEVLAERAKRATDGKGAAVNQVFENGTLAEIVEYVKREKPNINNPEAYAQGVLRKRLAPVFAEGTEIQKAAAQVLSTSVAQDRYTKMIEFAKSGKITPRDEQAPRVLTDEEAHNFAKAVVKKDNKVVMETGTKDQVVDVARQMRIPEDRRVAFADAVLAQRK